MSVNAVIHLNLPGNAREALEFYASVFDGQVQAMTYADFGAPAETPGADKIVFGQVSGANGFTIMAYDIPAHAALPTVDAFVTQREQGLTLTNAPSFISLRGDSVEEITDQWKGLSEGATVIEELAASAWAPLFGMLTDRFGQTWVLGVEATHG